MSSKGQRADDFYLGIIGALIGSVSSAELQAASYPYPVEQQSAQATLHSRLSSAMGKGFLTLSQLKGIWLILWLGDVLRNVRDFASWLSGQAASDVEGQDRLNSAKGAKGQVVPLPILGPHGDAMGTAARPEVRGTVR